MFLRSDNTIKWRFFGVAAAVVLILCLAGIFGLDKPIYLFLRNFDGEWARIIGIVFDDKMWFPIVFVTMMLIYVKNIVKSKDCWIKNIKRFNLREIWGDFKEKSKANPVFFVFCSILATGVFVKLLKYTIGRARPVFYEALNHTGFYPFTNEWAFNSMPSGHTAISFAGLVMIGMLFPKIKWMTWTLAILVGVSRICTGAHWPSDVLFGAFIGMFIADLIKKNIKYKV